MEASNIISIGQYLALRLEQLGMQHFFEVPGDYNLALLDELLKNQKLKEIGCCNELNAGYAADGYARAFGVSAVVVTFTVGGMSIINAIGGAYAEDLPVICISGGPNSTASAHHHLLHHTLGKVSYGYMARLFTDVTVCTEVIRHADTAALQIDRAIEMALQKRKPVYIEIACNIAGSLISRPTGKLVGFKPYSDPESLNIAVDYALKVLNEAVKPVLVAGVKLRANSAIDSFKNLADQSGYAVAAMPNAKSFFPEEHQQYIGIYWGAISSPGCGEIIESADVYLFAGPLFTDYTTVGYTELVTKPKLIRVDSNHVTIAGQLFSNVAMNDFLKSLSEKIKSNPASAKAYQRIAREESLIQAAPGSDEPVKIQDLFSEIQQLLTADSTIIAETGDSWFNCMSLKLPAGCHFEVQMQYGSIGWSVGATLGYQIAVGNSKRVIALIGDGSFQMAAQEVSTMIRYGIRPIIFLINNNGYTIEVEIHDGPYNNIKNWQYAKLIEIFNANDGNGKSAVATTVGELKNAIIQAEKHDGLFFIEIVVDRHDCNKNLLKWGSYVANFNGRPPDIQQV